MKLAMARPVQRLGGLSRDAVVLDKILPISTGSLNHLLECDVKKMTAAADASCGYIGSRGTPCFFYFYRDRDSNPVVFNMNWYVL